MKKYETPNISVTRYGLSDKVMDGYIDGDVNTLPDKWAELFTTQAAGSPAGPDANILD